MCRMQSSCWHAPQTTHIQSDKIAMKCLFAAGAANRQQWDLVHGLTYLPAMRHAVTHSCRSCPICTSSRCMPQPTQALQPCPHLQSVAAPIQSDPLLPASRAPEASDADTCECASIVAERADCAPDRWKQIRPLAAQATGLGLCCLASRGSIAPILGLLP